MKSNALWWLALLTVLAAAPHVPGFPAYWVVVLCYIGIATIVTTGLVVLAGVAGLISFGQAMFVGIGAYTAAITATRYEVSPLMTLPMSVAICVIVAWAVGAITLRLKGHYLAVATIAWNVSFFFLVANLDFFRRYDGISGIPPLSFFGHRLLNPKDFYPVILVAAACSFLLTGNLLESRTGRTIRALRGGAIAAESFGIDTFHAKVVAFVYAAALAGFAGWSYAHFERAVNPTSFSLNVSIDYLMMTTIGGIEHIPGAMLGAAVVGALRYFLQDLLSGIFRVQGGLETIVLCVVLIVILQRNPDGIWPALARRFGRPAGVTPSGTEKGVVAHRVQPMSGSELMRAEDLSKSFGGLRAVDQIDFTLNAGEIVGLIGPNGAGKSTTFNLITGVLSASSGRVTLEGRKISGLPARQIARLGIARTFQHVKLVRGMNVVENVAIGMHLSGKAGVLRAMLRLDRGDEARIFANARVQLERVGLSNHVYARADELSLGQQRMVEIARALCLDPILLLLDEPAAGLRHLEKAALARLLSKLRDEGMTILMVEHDMDFVMQITDRLVVMNFGSKLAQGKPEEVQRNEAVIEAYLGAEA
ncbi:branched-chain amino acid ABC transporter ATP-binding protein/permease [Bradyrhizobium sp. 186]|uniref:branched-chain amino acid ABC transporter ATP-binding protein/permease n=1 Tax=Bradyrhizobium sp. 186 TaxID=2782654 RepID=UPI0020012E0C|nr:branched-chain amino acid ABC transporter ATP-binding protein/permease [Bradyrhizobium sp. 186]UPK38538.1 branched-chain amino acid ABC transporter ATP-binding protein/permease [Bradyrhizobium sp. 186]